MAPSAAGSRERHMEREELLGSQFRHLLTNLSEHGTQHLTEIETDLMQTSVLLSEAIEKLGASFMCIHSAVSAQQQAMEDLIAGMPATPELAGQLKARQAEIDHHINAVVTGLQFQDMTGQLIGRTVKRVAGLRDVLVEVGVGSADMAKADNLEKMIHSIEEINRVFQEKSVKLEGGLWKAVCQTHMESGDIELF